MKLTKGEIPALGVSHMASLCIGWTDGSNHRSVADYFDVGGRYLGASPDGAEPLFRELTSTEVAEYLSQELGTPIDRRPL